MLWARLLRPAGPRTKTGDTSTAIVRLEQLYPLQTSAIAEALAPFSGAELVWVQDEPANQGMWPYLALHLPADLTGGVLPTLISRAEPLPGRGNRRRAPRPAGRRSSAHAFARA